MDLSTLIPEVIKLVFEEKNIGVCSSCPGDCDIMTRFICLGFNAEDINQYIKSHPDKIKEIEEKYEAELEALMCEEEC